MDLSLFPDRSAVAGSVWASRVRSSAHRILAGLGDAVVVAYREEPAYTLTSIAHGIAADGSLVIATIEPMLAEALSNREACAMDVRLSISKHAPDPSVDVLVASVHLLGEAEWLDAAARVEAVASGFLPERVAEIAAMRGGMLAIVRTDRVLIHDCAGVTPLAYEEIATQHQEADWLRDDALTCPEGELTAFDACASFAPSALRELVDSSALGLGPGVMMAHQIVDVGCSYGGPDILCLDVDRTGVTLMRVADGEATTVFVPFDAPVCGARDAREAIASLVDCEL